MVLGVLANIYISYSIQLAVATAPNSLTSLYQERV